MLPPEEHWTGLIRHYDGKALRGSDERRPVSVAQGSQRRPFVCFCGGADGRPLDSDARVDMGIFLGALCIDAGRQSNGPRGRTALSVEAGVKETTVV